MESGREAHQVTKSEYKVGNITVKQIHFNEIDSTQTWSENNVRMSYPEDDGVYTLVTANIQTAGIGTHSRKWVSHIPGNVYASLSFLVEPILNVSEFSEKKIKPFPQLSAIAVLETLKDFGVESERLKVKWPNDVMADEKKISGSMTGTAGTVIQGEYLTLVLGVGVNVQLTEQDLSGNNQPATSLMIATGKKFSEKDVLSKYLSNFIKIVNDYNAKPNGFFDSFYKNMAYINETIIAHDDSVNKNIEGVMKGVTGDGFLILETDDNETLYIRSGTVVKKH